MKKTLCLGLLVLLAACQDVSPKLVPKPDAFKKPEWTRVEGGTREFVFNPQVDILFVVDDSGSMAEEQANLASNITKFTDSLNKLSALDYHIGVITSSTSSGWGGGGVNSDGRLVGSTTFVTKTTPNIANILKSNLIVGINGSAIEKFYEPVQLALSIPNVGNHNRGFYRPDAHLALIFITDAEEQSDISTQAFYDFLVALKNNNKDKVLGYAAFIPTGETLTKNCSRDDSSEPQKIEDFLKMTKAKPLSLCDPNFGAKLADLGLSLAKRVGRTLYLDRPPVIESIRVMYGDDPIPNDVRIGWSYNPELNALEFGPDVAWGVMGDRKITVDYQIAEYE